MLFRERINGWDSWCRIFQSTDTFALLADAIFKREGLAANAKIHNLTPGTNAVFRADKYVIKIYAPPETDMDTENDYKTERLAMQFAKDHKVSVPQIIGYGEFQDSYLFRYLIMEYIPAARSIPELLRMPAADKKQFIQQIKQIQWKMNRFADGLLSPIDLTKQDKRTERMAGLNLNLIWEMSKYAENLDFRHSVLVHGDMTSENVLIRANGIVSLIDFADCLMAPSFYELPPIIFELFLCDKELVAEYIGQEDRNLFLDNLIKGLSVHLFSGFILRDYFDRIHIPRDSIKSVQELRHLLQVNVLYSAQ